VLKTGQSKEMTIESDAKTLTDEVGKCNTELTAAFSTGKTNKAAVKRARAALGEVKKLAAKLRKDLQAKVNAEVAAAAGGKA
jgi:non-homologous end joining protein Ku